MTLAEFREAVHAEFGPQMERATPEHVNNFLCRIYAQLYQTSGTAPLCIERSDGPFYYEEIVGRFFARVLNSSNDQAVILLWLFAAELFYSRLGEQFTEDMRNLFTYDLSE